jgi:diguanylate cyclase (GGDEF)-like protein/PAS domain S-box-containing protein
MKSPGPAGTFALEESLTRFADALPTGVFALADRILYVNPALEKLAQRSLEELRTWEPARLLPEAQVPEDGSPITYELVLPMPEGGSVRLTAQCNRSELSGEPVVIGSILDRTDRAAYAEGLELSTQQWMSGLALITSVAIFVSRQRFLFANRTVEALTGYSHRELMEMDPLHLIHPDFRDMIAHRRQARMEGEAVASGDEIVLIRRSGEERWIEYSASRVLIDGEPAVLATAYDVTERKRTELSMRQNEGRLRLAQRAVGVVTWDWNLLTDELEVSDQSADRLLFPETGGKVTSAHYFDQWIHPDDRAPMRAAIKNTLRHGRELEVEHRVVQADKGERWVSVRGHAVRDETGWVVRMLGVSIDVTEHKQVEMALRTSEARLRLMVEQMPAVLWTADASLRVTSSVGAGLKRLGLDTKEVVGMPLEEFLDNDDPLYEPVAFQRRALEGHSASFELPWKERLYQAHVEPLRGPLGDIVGCIGIALDVTARHRAEDALFQEKVRADATLASIGDGVIRLDAQGHVDYLNPVAERLSGFTTAEAVGRPIGEIYTIVDEATRKPLLSPVERCLRENRTIMLPGERLLVTRDGREYAVRDSAAPVRGRSGEVMGVVLAFKDITGVRDMEREMSYLASHDRLTGLLNRAEFERRMAQALSVDGAEALAGVLHLDIDPFVVVNDTCGYLAGDEMLKRVAELLRGCVVDNRSLARLGADEFGLLLLGDADAEIRHPAETIREAFRDFTFSWLDKTFDVGVSIGLVRSRQDDRVSRLMLAADSACQLAKKKGRNVLYEYQPGDSGVARRRGQMHWLHRINRALEEDNFELYCQPIRPRGGFVDGEMMAEVLVRMVDEKGQLVPPERFIPVAERYRLISSIDRWVFSRSLRALAAGTYLGDQQVTSLAINLSGESLNDDEFLDFVGAELTRSKVDPARVLFEITETAAIANLQGALRFISDLKERGSRFVLDDFGSGLSSFAYLKNLPVDILKIAIEFVRDSASASVERTIVRSINQIGHDLGLQTIAEGVESPEVLQVCDDLGLDYSQGYWICPPQRMSSEPGGSPLPDEPRGTGPDESE